jgi:hypothetical protein
MKIKITILFLLASFFVQAQTYRYKATSFCIKKLSYGYWEQWSAPDAVSIDLTFSIDEKQFKIFSATTQIYDIVKDEGKHTDSDGDDSYQFLCLDADNNTCRIIMEVLHSQNDREQIYINYSDIKWMYNIYSVK